MTDGPELLRIGFGGVVPVQWSLEKSDDGPGSLTGWASVYNVVDQQDDIVAPGAFRKTIAQWRQGGGKRVIPLTLDHQNTAEGVIGSLVKAEDTAYGLKTTFHFSSTPKAQEARTKAREGHLNGLSIWGPIFDSGVQMVAGKSIRVLKEVGLGVVGLTPIPANADSLVLTAKDQSPEVLAGMLGFDEFADAMRKALEIDHPAAKKAAVHILLGSYQTELATKAVTTEPVATDAIVDDTSEDDSASYALQIAGIGPGEDPPDGGPSDSLAGLFASLDADETKSELDSLEAELKRESP